MTGAILGLLLSLIAPLLLLPIEKLFPWPYLIEEAVKLAMVLLIIKSERGIGKRLGIWVLLAGFFFALSESILYLGNIFALGNLEVFPKRLLLTGTLHSSTMLLMFFLGKKNYFWGSLGFGGAVLIHYLFNLRGGFLN